MDYVDIVLDGPPEQGSGRLVEVEDNVGRSSKIGEWVQRPNGHWALRIRPEDFQRPVRR